MRQWRWNIAPRSFHPLLVRPKACSTATRSFMFLPERPLSAKLDSHGKRRVYQQQTHFLTLRVGLPQRFVVHTYGFSSLSI